VPRWNDLCQCEAFDRWYSMRWDVCVCGHRDIEHLAGRGSCTGEIIVDYPAGEPDATAQPL